MIGWNIFFWKKTIKKKKFIKNRNISGNENNSGTNERDTLDLKVAKIKNFDEDLYKKFILSQKVNGNWEAKD